MIGYLIKMMKSNNVMSINDHWDIIAIAMSFPS